MFFLAGKRGVVRKRGLVWKRVIFRRGLVIGG